VTLPIGDNAGADRSGEPADDGESAQGCVDPGHDITIVMTGRAESDVVVAVTLRCAGISVDGMGSRQRSRLSPSMRSLCLSGAK
jgi:hypothetical protein